MEQTVSVAAVNCDRTNICGVGDDDDTYIIARGSSSLLDQVPRPRSHAVLGDGGATARRRQGEIYVAPPIRADIKSESQNKPADTGIQSYGGATNHRLVSLLQYVYSIHPPLQCARWHPRLHSIV